MVGYCMITETVKITYIRADKGKVLTNGTEYVKNGQRVALGINDSKDNWHEITEEEYNTILEVQSKEQDIMEE